MAERTNREERGERLPCLELGLQGRRSLVPSQSGVSQPRVPRLDEADDHMLSRIKVRVAQYLNRLENLRLTIITG